MFSGIVQEIGIIDSLVEGNEHLTITVSCSVDFAEDKKVGDSFGRWCLFNHNKKN